MAYSSKNPKFNTAILTDQSAGAVANPASGSHKLVDRSGSIYVRNSSGTEVQLLTGNAASNYSAQTASYTVLDNDNVRTVGMTTGATNRTVTLPVAANNSNRIITVKKIDSGAGKAVVAPNGTDNIDGSNTSLNLANQGDALELQSDGTGWHILDHDLVAVPGTSSGLISASGVPGNTTGSAIATGFVGERIDATLSDVSAGTFDSSVNAGTLSLNKGVYLVFLHSVSTSAATTQAYASVSISTTSATHDNTYRNQDDSTQISVNHHVWSHRHIVITADATTLYYVGTINGSGASNGTFKGNATGSTFYAVRIA